MADRTIIVGGTGLLGYHSALALLSNRHEVTSLSSGSLPIGPWYPSEIDRQTGDVFSLTFDELRDRFEGHRNLIYAVGPDDRVTPPRPAARFFDERLVETTDRVCRAAAAAGVERIVVFGSYFTYLHRIDPGRKLAQHHPYIAARVEQLARCRQIESDDLSIAVFEIPYVFATMPEREPLWMDVLVARLNRMKPWIFFPPGGTATVSAGFVGRAAVAAIERGIGGPLPIGEENIDWRVMLGIASEELYGHERRVVTVPGPIAALYGAAQQVAHRLRGEEPGLRYARYIADVQARHSYFPEAAMNMVAEDLGIARGPIEPSLRETFARCRDLA